MGTFNIPTPEEAIEANNQVNSELTEWYISNILTSIKDIKNKCKSFTFEKSGSPINQATKNYISNCFWVKGWEINWEKHTIEARMNNGCY
jgi:hypothetical protein